MEQMENGKLFDQMSGKPLIFYFLSFKKPVKSRKVDTIDGVIGICW